MMCAAKPEATSLVLVEEFAHRVLNEYTQAIAGLNLAARRAENANARRQLTDAADRRRSRRVARPTYNAGCFERMPRLAGRPL
jgi:two-component sensor histidine kinase